MSPRLFVPPQVADELRAESRGFASLVDTVCHKDVVCREWDRELSRLDPLLDMIKAPDQQVPGTPLVPGAYHVRRNNDAAPPSLIPVRDENGEPITPPGRLLDQLKAMDLWNVNVPQMLERIRYEQERREEHSKQREREARRSAIVSDYKAVTNASVSMNTDTAWGQNARGAAIARANRKKES